MPINSVNNNLNRSSNLGMGRLALSNNGSSSRPGPPASLGSKRTPSSRRGALDQIDIGKIGKGYMMTEGSYGTNSGVNRYSGLKGQLAKVRNEGRRSVTKNLSAKNLEQMHDLLSGPISRNAVSSSTYISRRDQIEIMRKSRQLAKQKDSGFSYEDRDDLLKLVGNMRKQHRDSLFGDGQDRDDRSNL